MDALKRFLTHPWTVRICQIAIGIVLIAAALPKIGDVQSFATALHNYRIVPIAAANILAITLPWVELVAGLALILGIRPRSGAAIASALMVVFLVAIVAAMVRGLDIECGCFGTSDATKVGIAKLAENTAYVILSVVAFLRPH